MAAANLTFIPDLDVTRDDLTFKLRVINLWDQMCFYKKNEIWSIEMILMDEKGNKIQATVSKRNIYRFKNIVKEGMPFYIKGPDFAALKIDTFKLTPQDQKLTFVPQTVVIKCNDFSGHEFGFSFVDYQNILSFAHPQDKSVDVMGLVVAVAEIQRHDPDKSKHKLNINIQDAKGLQLHFYLWGDYAYKMQEYIHNNPHNRRIVVILQFGQINVFRDRRSVNTYFTSSKLFINSHIDEIIRFNKSLDGDDVPDSSTNTFSVIPSKQLSEYDDFMIKNKLNAISEVWEPVEKCSFVIVGTIKGILQNKTWYYKACTNCFGKAVPFNGSDDQQTKSYVCHNGDCTKDTTSVVPRFMIPIRVQDNTGTLTLTMFERDGKYLLKQSPKELVKKTIETLIKSQDLWEFVENGCPTEDDEALMKENKRKDAKALSIIQQAVHDTMFSKITASSTAQEAWEVLREEFHGDSKVAVVRRQSLRREFENLAMKDEELLLISCKEVWTM
ncbi:unnamed protein product [Lactuca virosa]|uniref:Replication factor A C-terminal domain-containing protein n=1 Tax=Lactuca virosa TaxID=75947 RepID=A0AAU9M5M4_9ASTR|nr:unnamed protein product [Lactuca virosa]